MNRRERRRQEKLAKRGTRPPVSTSGGFDVAATLRQALALYRSGDADGATELCRQVLRAHPDHADTLNFLGVIGVERGDAEAGIGYLRGACSAQPDNPQFHYNLGTALAAAGQLDEACASHRRALDLKPAYADAHYNLANVLRQLDGAAEAVSHYRAALDLDPGYPGAATNLASLYLETEDPKNALDACEAALRGNPGDRDALAFKAIACSELGDRKTASSILDFDRFIRCYDRPCPAGFESMRDFNRALVEHVLTHPTLTREPHNKSTRSGQQTENLAIEPKGPIAQLEDLIGAAMDDYLAAVPPSDTHPYRTHMPPLTRIDIWGTVLDRQGHQAPHMHRAAWLSGVYYAQLPDVMSMDDDTRQGWIEFGRPQDRFPCRIEPEVRIYEPKEGRMFLFPSYAYHRTIPFESDQQRISIAFDLLA